MKVIGGIPFGDDSRVEDILRGDGNGGEFFAKEGALFVMASGQFAALLFACAYNSMARAKKTSNKTYDVLLVIMAAIWAVSGIYILFAPENTLRVYMIIVGILAIIDGIVRVIRAYNIRHRWYIR